MALYRSIRASRNSWWHYCSLPFTLCGHSWVDFASLWHLYDTRSSPCITLALVWHIRSSQYLFPGLLCITDTSVALTAPLSICMALPYFASPIYMTFPVPFCTLLTHLYNSEFFFLGIPVTVSFLITTLTILEPRQIIPVASRSALLTSHSTHRNSVTTHTHDPYPYVWLPTKGCSCIHSFEPGFLCGHYKSGTVWCRTEQRDYIFQTVSA